MAEMILRSEPKHPMHIVPECWQIFNQEYDVQRGLFFLDGPDWYKVFLHFFSQIVAFFNKRCILDEKENEPDISEIMWNATRP